MKWMDIRCDMNKHGLETFKTGEDGESPTWYPSWMKKKKEGMTYLAEDSFM